MLCLQPRFLTTHTPTELTLLWGLNVVKLSKVSYIESRAAH